MSEGKKPTPWSLRTRFLLGAVAVLTSDRDELRSLLSEALVWIENGDWSNGVTGPSGSPDEGVVRGHEFMDRIRQTLADTKG